MLKRTGVSFREDQKTLWIRAAGTESIIEAQSAKPWSWTHKRQGPCDRGSREDSGNVDRWLKICEPPMCYCWDSISRDCEEQE